MLFGKEKFLDANVFVYAFLDTAQTEKAEKELAEGTVTDALVVAEVFTKLRTITKNHRFARKAVREILGSYEVRPVTADTLFEAIKHESLDIFDAIHFVCSNDCALVTFDKNLESYRKKIDGEKT